MPKVRLKYKRVIRKGLKSVRVELENGRAVKVPMSMFNSRSILVEENKICDFCDEYKDDVESTIDPLAYELDGVEQEVDACDLCLDIRSQEV